MSIYAEHIRTDEDLAEFMRINLRDIIAAIYRERAHQDTKYGKVLELRADGVPGFEQGPGGHEISGWLLVIEKELNEAKEAATGKGKREKTGRHSSRAEILQIAAVCVAALEQHGLPEDV